MAPHDLRDLGCVSSWWLCPFPERHTLLSVCTWRPAFGGHVPGYPPLGRGALTRGKGEQVGVAKAHLAGSQCKKVRWLAQYPHAPGQWSTCRQPACENLIYCILPGTPANQRRGTCMLKRGPEQAWGHYSKDQPASGVSSEAWDGYLHCVQVTAQVYSPAPCPQVPAALLSISWLFKGLQLFLIHYSILIKLYVYLISFYKLF